MWRCRNACSLLSTVSTELRSGVPIGVYTGTICGNQTVEINVPKMQVASEVLIDLHRGRPL